jgi:hypothetical protein
MSDTNFTNWREFFKTSSRGIACVELLKRSSLPVGRWSTPEGGRARHSVRAVGLRNRHDEFVLIREIRV